MIPKIIWQTHEWEYEELPQNFKRATQTWINLNPGWEYRYHSAIDRAVSVRDFDQKLYQYYMFADKVTQSDIWRYIVIYQYGGVYADMDSFCTSPLDYYLNTEYNNSEVFCTELISPGGTVIDNNGNTVPEETNNSNFGAIKKSNTIKEIIESIKNKYYKENVHDIYINIENESNLSVRYIYKNLWLGSYAFSKIIIKNKKNVCFNFKSAIHSKDIKEKFNLNFNVDYNGSIISYTELCKSMGWKDIL